MLSGIVNSLVGQGQLVQLAASTWHIVASGTSAVTSFMGRVGAIILNAADIATALGFTPASNAVLINAGAGLTGGGSLTGNVTLAMASLGSAGSYTNATVTVDGLGRVTGASSGAAPTTYTADETTLHLSGSTFSINTGYVGQASITTVGTVTTGVWSATALVAAKVPSLDAITSPAADVSINTHKLTNVVDPANPQDAATKNYVDMAVAAIQAKNDCKCATTAALPASTYANGTAGVGATLTANVAAVLVLDGVTPALNDRILVKNQASAVQNGIYFLSTVGTVLVPSVLTRSLDFDQPGDGINGALVYVLSGTTNGNTLWSCTTAGTITFGTTNINWSQFTGTTYTADEVTLHLGGTTFSILANGVTNAQLAQMPSATIKGNVTAGTANPTDLTPGQGVLVLGLRQPIANALTDYYVATTGNDLGPGNNPANAWQTIQHAVNVISAFDLQGQNITIHVAAGTYTGAVSLPNLVGGGTVTILGVGATTIISTTSASCFFQGSPNAGYWILDSMKLQTTTSGDCILAASGSGVIQFQNITFGASAANHIHAIVSGFVVIGGNYTVLGNAGDAHMHTAGTGATISNSAAHTVTVGASITIGSAWANADRNSEHEVSGLTFSLGAFTVTGIRYLSQNGGGIYTSGGGASYFPGTIAGTATSPGWYA